MRVWQLRVDKSDAEQEACTAHLQFSPPATSPPLQIAEAGRQGLLLQRFTLKGEEL
jgi:hypothetical protein